METLVVDSTIAHLGILPVTQFSLAFKFHGAADDTKLTKISGP